MTDLANDKPDRLTVSCHKCGKAFAAIELIEQSGRLGLQLSGFIGAVTAMEIAQKAVDRELFNKIRILIRTDLLELHQLDSDAFGFICRKCSCAYCIDCWENVHETFDEGFHDDTRGRCPEGHEQMLRD
jgi:hypothetical protein